MQSSGNHAAADGDDDAFVRFVKVKNCPPQRAMAVHTHVHTRGAMLLVLLFAVALASCCAAAARRLYGAPRRVDTWREITTVYSKVASTGASSSPSHPHHDIDPYLRLGFGLYLHNQADLEDLVRQISNPRSERYGQFLTYEQLHTLTGRDESIPHVRRFLHRSGGRNIHLHSNRMWFEVDLPISTVERIFQTHGMRQYHHDTLGTIYRADSYIIPFELEGHIELITSLVDFPFAKEDHTTWNRQEKKMMMKYHQRKRRLIEDATTSSDVDIDSTTVSTPPSVWPPGPYMNQTVLNWNYNIRSNTVRNVGTTGSVFEVAGPYESFMPGDLTTFQTLNGISLQNVTHFSGGLPDETCASYQCAEPDLDVEMFLGTAQGTNFTYWTNQLVPTPPSGNVVLQWLLDMQSASASSGTPPPYINSISWGPPESHLTPDVAQRMEAEFARLVAMGCTFLVSSGDDGVNDRTARQGTQSCGFSPQYPAASAWVTTVGGTMGPEYGQPPVTCEADIAHTPAVITSGGGFSIYNAQPSYQTEAVESYISYMSSAGLLPPSGPNTYNASGRAYPDISLAANHLHTIVNNAWMPGSGTSASAPLMAGLLALILDARLSAGMPPIGLFNIALYQMASGGAGASSGLLDLTTGSNNCTALNYQLHPPAPVCCPQGFRATKGWDPATGVGTVGDFEILKSQMLKTREEWRW